LQAEFISIGWTIETCPERDLLWFHHVPWTYKMKSGKTLWHELCYHYYQGVEGVEEIQKIWNSLKGKIDEEEFYREQMLLKIQYEDAISWMDVFCIFRLFHGCLFRTG